MFLMWGGGGGKQKKFTVLLLSTNQQRNKCFYPYFNDMNINLKEFLHSNIWTRWKEENIIIYFFSDEKISWLWDH
jgi:hypothetical protein